MKVLKDCHLTYCTNIHTEKSWSSLFQSLSKILPAIKEKISPEEKFGIGLRISDHSCRELLDDNTLSEFRDWLNEKGLYVFTLNGFPYGVFHESKVKDDVHKPDWTTQERVEYTLRLCRVLAVLLPDGMDGGISTSPLSYKPWYREIPQKVNAAMKSSSLHLARVVEEMLIIKKESGKLLHLDIEPEPDGLIENSSETIDYYNKYLIPVASEYLVKTFSITAEAAEEAIRTHIRICYDVCHFSVEFEKHEDAIHKLTQAGIKIGKVQLSSALKASFGEDKNENRKILRSFEKLVDPVYLHQVIEKNNNDQFRRFTDLPEALRNFVHTPSEWRTHYHVPLFHHSFNELSSMQDEVMEVIKLITENSITKHLEVETYTWKILPEELKSDLQTSIVRELNWVLHKLEVPIETVK
jgi:hypothetical protein